MARIATTAILFASVLLAQVSTALLLVSGLSCAVNKRPPEPVDSFIGFLEEERLEAFIPSYLEEVGEHVDAMRALRELLLRFSMWDVEDSLERLSEDRSKRAVAEVAARCLNRLRLGKAPQEAMAIRQAVDAGDGNFLVVAMFTGYMSRQSTEAARGLSEIGGKAALYALAVALEESELPGMGGVAVMQWWSEYLEALSTGIRKLLREEGVVHDLSSASYAALLAECARVLKRRH